MNTEGLKQNPANAPASFPKKKVLLVSLDRGKRDYPLEELMDELEMLLGNLDLFVVRKIVQKREKEDPATFLGKGKAEELGKTAIEYGASVIVFDGVLSPVQVKNLKEKTGCSVWDRPWVIMEVFRRHARSSEAKLQVELARCRYEIPHLKGLGQQMSRTGAGIATRGPGETEFERHRRKIERRIRDIEKKLREITERRYNQRKRRSRSGLPVVSLVGYTNAGKSTLFKALSGDSLVRVKDQLFTTLDTTVRTFSLPFSGTALLADTVGFLRNLPPGLIAAFRSTLEEVLEADALVWVVDATKTERETVISSVEETLRELGAWEIPRIVALNKIDLLEKEEVSRTIREIELTGERVVPISAKDRIGFEDLKNELEKVLLEKRMTMEGKR